jgi:drug/metabolite transporter (DMT)-like permease
VLHLDSARGRRIGIALVTLTTLCFATLDATAKWLIQTLPVFEVVWLRFLAHTVVTSVLLGPVYGRSMLRVHNPKLQLVRGLLLATMTAMNFWALQYLQLAQTAAIQFSVPLMIALLSAWYLHEHLDWRRWAAIIAGFVGVLLVVRPGSQGFHPAILVSVAQAVLYAFFSLLTRHMAAHESPAATQLMSAFCATVMLAPFALAQWQTPTDLQSWALIGVCGLVGGFGHFWVAQAHRYASAATLSPFLYQQIIYMTLWGWLLFGQWPDAGVALGAAIVVASGLSLLWIEMKRA